MNPSDIEANIVVAVQKEIFRDHFLFDKIDSAPHSTANCIVSGAILQEPKHAHWH